MSHSVDFDAINRVALNRFEDLLGQFLPDGKRVNGEYVARNPRRNDRNIGSFSINLHSGVWKDFADDSGGGDPVSLWAYLFGLPSQSDAARLLASHLGVPELAPDYVKPANTTANQDAGEWVPIMPVPDDAPAPPDIKWYKDGEQWIKRKIVARWAYRDAGGALLGYVARVELPEGGKDVVPQTFCQSESGDRKWRVKSFPKPRPLYGLDRLTARPDAPVVIFEGEKTADAGSALIDRCVSVTWAGGAEAIGYVDLEPLRGRSVALWPDNDAAGFKAMMSMAARLGGIAAKIVIVRPPEWADAGWDVADDAPDDWSAVAHLRGASVVPSEFFKQDDNGDGDSGNFAVTQPQSRRLDTNAVDWFSPFPDVGGKGKPIGTIENLVEACRRLGVTVRYNVISKEVEILIPNEGFSVDNAANASIAWLESCCNRFGLPTGGLDGFLCYMADKNQYNPVAEWITSKPWDGRTRLLELISTIRAAGEEDDSLIGENKETLMKRWLVSAVAAAFEPDGVSAHGILVMQGDQYLGKTAWFKSLVPESLRVIQDGIILRPDDKDSVKQAMSNWLVELGELDATFRKSDISQLKAFVTRKSDVLRRAYAKKESHYARRTVFFASVNPREFLHDPTGNRRYWTISCESINHKHGIDMQQLWAEVYEMYKAGEPWHLSYDELDRLNEHNREFEVLDPIKERLQTKLNWAAHESEWRWTTSTDVMIEIGFDRPTKADVTHCGSVLRELNGGKSKRTNSKRVSFVPPLFRTY